MSGKTRAASLKSQIKDRADKGQFKEIVTLIEQIPEAERDWETIGAYVRALNNSDRAEQAIEVSMKYQKQGANDPFWHYRLGYAYYWLDRYDEARPILLRAKELAEDGSELMGWINGLLAEVSAFIKLQTIAADWQAERSKPVTSVAYRLQDDKGDRFWRVEYDGNFLALNYGKTGATGKYQVKQFASPEECEQTAEKLIAAKVKQGYKLYTEFAPDNHLYFDDPEIGLHPLTSHPKFRRCFTEEFYYDQGDEEAPFGSDEGHDTLQQIEKDIKKGKALDFATFPKKLIEEYWGMKYIPPSDMRREEVKALVKSDKMNLTQSDIVTRAVAFALIKITGKIDSSMITAARFAIWRMELTAGTLGWNTSGQLSEFATKMIADLEAFENLENHTWQPQREFKEEFPYVSTIKNDKYNQISVCFSNEQDKPFAIGEKMNAINEDAYMNGYNWDAFFNYYLSKYAPDVFEGLESDPEAGSYVAYYPLTPENEAKAQRFAEIIIELIEHEAELYRIVREEGDQIEWD
jgi:uncharacterized protein YfeS